MVSEKTPIVPGAMERSNPGLVAELFLLYNSLEDGDENLRCRWISIFAIEKPANLGKLSSLIL